MQARITMFPWGLFGLLWGSKIAKSALDLGREMARYEQQTAARMDALERDRYGRTVAEIQEENERERLREIEARREREKEEKERKRHIAYEDTHPYPLGSKCSDREAASVYRANPYFYTMQRGVAFHAANGRSYVRSWRGPIHDVTGYEELFLPEPPPSRSEVLAKSLVGAFVLCVLVGSCISVCAPSDGPIKEAEQLESVVTAGTGSVGEPAPGADQMRLPAKQEVKRVSRQEVDEAWHGTMMQINDRLRREEARAEVRRAEAAQLWLEQKKQLNDALRKEEARAAAGRLEAEKLWKEEMKIYNPPSGQKKPVKAHPSKTVVNTKASGEGR